MTASITFLSDGNPRTRLTVMHREDGSTFLTVEWWEQTVGGFAQKCVIFNISPRDKTRLANAIWTPAE